MSFRTHVVSRPSPRTATRWALPVLLLLAGCAGPGAVTNVEGNLPDAFPYHTEAQIAQHIRLSADTLRAFDAKVAMAVRSPQQSGSYSGDLRSRRGDSLFISVSPGLGIEAVRALVTPDSFFVYDRVRKTVTYGSVEDAGRLLPAPLTAEDIFQNLLGIVAPDATEDWNVTADSSYYYLVDAPGRRRYVVDPSIWRVIRYEETDAGGTLVERRLFSSFDRFAGVVLPRRVVLQVPGEDTTVSIYYRRLTLNPATLSFALRVSRSARYERVR